MPYEWVMQFRKCIVPSNSFTQKKTLRIQKNLYRDLFDEMEAKVQ